jgi:tetratricopeptide (TPR) repeat protein
MSYKKINNIVGWVVCLIACAVYMITKEKSASFWDCGEFLSGSYKLEVVHSPGAPLFLLIGRIFTMFGDKMSAAANVNTLSALASGFAVLFLFWSITHFGKRIMEKNGNEISGGNLIAILGAGIVGALAYTFSDTAWFSAVEGEVYSLSSFLTALVFWAILKWEDQTRDNESSNKKFADRWIIMIFYIMGLSIGVHLLNLLAIPAIIMVYYFCRYKVTTAGLIAAGLIGVAGLGLVQKGVIQWIPTLAGKLDLLFVNSFGLPFNLGALLTLIAVIVGLIFAVFWAKKRNMYEVHLSLLSFLFVIIGYSSYLMIIIRSSADVPIDMTNPDNPLALVKYLQREQYGNTPIVFGPDYNSQPNDVTMSDENYYKGKDRYEALGKTVSEYKFPASEKRLFPRLWDMNDPRHVSFYKSYLGLGDEDKPSAFNNLSFFVRYQCIQMYWRYFMWNFVGRQNDTQNIQGEADGGNWISGVKIVDKIFGRGDVDKLPKGLRDNMARNHLYGLPFILGILGAIFHFRKDKLNAIIVALLFFFTGFAIVIYLNNTPLQPRERDYAYVGSFYTFAIWIGLGVLFVYDLIKKFVSPMGAASMASLVCLLAVPAIMAKEEWDDHDRSRKTLAPASAKNFLACCDKNAILFTEGDNDTYPLWYLQEIEGYRTDVRVVNLSLLGIDWYIDQLNYKMNEADKVEMAWKPEDYRGNNLNYVRYAQSPNLPAGTSVDLNEVMAYLGNAAKQSANTPGREGQVAMPTQNVFIKTADSAGKMEWTIGNETYQKNDLGILSIIAGSFGKRPIYFSNTIDPKHYEGLYPFLIQEGIIYKLTSKNSGVKQVGAPTPVNTAKSYDLFMKTYTYGGAERNDNFYDQTSRRMLNIFRNGSAKVADELCKEGKKKEALDLLNHTLKGMSERSYAYSLSDEERSVVYLIDAYIKAGGKKEAEEIFSKLLNYQKDNMSYNTALSGDRKGLHDQELQSGMQTLSYIPQIAMGSGDTVLAKKFDEQIRALAGGGNMPMTPQLK